jgi:hypothetical protein
VGVAGEHESVFTAIMHARAWGDVESVSGAGSGLARTADLRARLPELLARLRVRSMLDADAATSTGCNADKRLCLWRFADLPLT